MATRKKILSVGASPTTVLALILGLRSSSNCAETSLSRQLRLTLQRSPKTGRARQRENCCVLFLPTPRSLSFSHIQRHTHATNRIAAKPKHTNIAMIRIVLTTPHRSGNLSSPDLSTYEAVIDCKNPSMTASRSHTHQKVLPMWPILYKFSRLKQNSSRRRTSNQDTASEPPSTVTKSVRPYTAQTIPSLCLSYQS